MISAAGGERDRLFAHLTPVLRASPTLRSAVQIFSGEVHLLNAHRCQVMATLRKIIEVQRQSKPIINIFPQNLGVGLT